MQITVTDQRGRITIGRKRMKRYGRKFAVVEGEGEIILFPLPKDPIKNLQELGKKAGLDKMSIKQIKKLIAEEANKEILSEL